jgi:hypothetical protein
MPSINNGLEVEAVIVTQEERDRRYRSQTAGNGWIILIVLVVLFLYTLGVVGPR